jgi:hypothetical protein
MYWRRLAAQDKFRFFEISGYPNLLAKRNSRAKPSRGVDTRNPIREL